MLTRHPRCSVNKLTGDSRCSAGALRITPHSLHNHVITEPYLLISPRISPRGAETHTKRCLNSIYFPLQPCYPRDRLIHYYESHQQPKSASSTTCHGRSSATSKLHRVVFCECDHTWSCTGRLRGPSGHPWVHCPPRTYLISRCRRFQKSHWGTVTSCHLRPPCPLHTPLVHLAL